MEKQHFLNIRATIDDNGIYIQTPGTYFGLEIIKMLMENSWWQE